MKVLCMSLYTFIVVYKYKSLSAVNTIQGITTCVLAATGGGILVPLFINGIPVPLVNDCYLLTMAANYLMQKNVPMLREVFGESWMLQVRGNKEF